MFLISIMSFGSWALATKLSQHDFAKSSFCEQKLASCRAVVMIFLKAFCWNKVKKTRLGNKEMEKQLSNVKHFIHCQPWLALTHSSGSQSNVFLFFNTLYALSRLVCLKRLCKMCLWFSFVWRDNASECFIATKIFNEFWDVDIRNHRPDVCRWLNLDESHHIFQLINRVEGKSECSLA